MNDISPADVKMLDEFAALVEGSTREMLERLVVVLVIGNSQEEARMNLPLISDLLRENQRSE